MLDALRKYAHLNATSMSAYELAEEVRSRGLHPPEPLPWGLAVVELFEATCEEHLVQPVFIYDHPIEISPLTKIKRGDSRLVERFEPFVCGMEIGNAYSELTDPVEQLQRFVAQRQAQSRGTNKGYENNPLDADFVKAIGCGMPPTGGVGLGIDRLVMLLTDSANIRDIIPFPMVKPRTD
jgi:lysyl-tRNA synthetase class 2